MYLLQYFKMISFLLNARAIKGTFLIFAIQAFYSWAELPSLEQFEEWCHNDNASLLKQALQKESEISRQSWLASAYFDPTVGHDENTGQPHYREGGTPLHVSAKHGCINMAEVLIHYGADVNAKNEGHITPFHKAARHGSIEMMELLLANGGDLDAQCVPPVRFTPLFIAAKENHLDAVTFLLERGAFPDSGYGMRAIHFAVRHGNLEMLQILLKYNATVDTPDFMGHTPLDLAEEKPQIKQLLSQYQ